MILQSRPRLGSWIGDMIATADNTATDVCPTVATVVGSAYGIPVGAVGGALPTLCHYSREIDPVHWLAVGAEHLFGTSSPAAAPDTATAAAQLQVQAQQTRKRLLIVAGLAGAGAVGYFALRRRS